MFTSAASFAQDVAAWNVQRVRTLTGRVPLVRRLPFAAAVVIAGHQPVSSMMAAMFNSIGLNNCTNQTACDCMKKTVYDAWGTKLRTEYPSWGDRTTNRCLQCATDQWKDPETAVCRRKALMAVLASSEVTVLEMTLVKSLVVRAVFQSIVLRLKDGDIDADPARIIKWTVARSGSAAQWLSLDRLNGSLHSGQSVADVKVTADGAGLGDTATAGPFNATLAFVSSAALMTSSDFVEGTDTCTVTVRLSIVAVPYINETHVTITRFSGKTVGPAEPIDAGEKLTVTVKAFDAEGIPITRANLPLRLELRGSLNKDHSTSLELNDYGTNVYKATIAETWVREVETVRSDVLSLYLAVSGRVRVPSPPTPRAGVRIDVLVEASLE
jgi:hypothetical protein